MFGSRGKTGAQNYFAAAAARSAPPATLVGRASNWLRLSAIGSAGILAALVTDLQNRGDNSALFVVSRSLVGLAALVGILSVPLWWTIGVLMAAGAGVVLYFKPSGLRPAFLQGFGTLAAVMTLVPGYGEEMLGARVDAGLVEEGTPVIERGDADEVAETETVPALPMAAASFVPISTQAATPAVEALVPAEATYEIAVRLTFPEGPPEPVAGAIRDRTLKARLYNANTGKAYNLFLSATEPIVRDGNRLLVKTKIPSLGDEGVLRLRIEAAGYEIRESEAQVSGGPNAVWDVWMSPTSEPLLLQRLKHTYAF